MLSVSKTLAEIIDLPYNYCRVIDMSFNRALSKRVSIMHTVRPFAALAVFFLLTSCAVDKMAINMVADALSKPGGTVWTGEDDPELVADAMPFAIKLYESLLEGAPDNTSLILSLGSVYVMYGNAFLQTPASMLPVADYQKKEAMLARSKKFFMKGKNLLISGLEKKHPGAAKLIAEKKTNEMNKLMTKDDVGYLYWLAAAWMSAFSVNAFDIDVAVGVPVAHSLIMRALELDESYSKGAIHDFLISFYAMVPLSRGGDDAKAKYHYEKALKLAGGMSASPYVTYATAMSVKMQNVKEFDELIEKALAVSTADVYDGRLANVLTQRRAKWLKEHRGDIFLLDDDKK